MILAGSEVGGFIALVVGLVVWAGLMMMEVLAAAAHLLCVIMAFSVLDIMMK